MGRSRMVVGDGLLRSEHNRVEATTGVIDRTDHPDHARQYARESA
jgi:hypothetical protein